MDINRFTEKAQEALSARPAAGRRVGHQQMDVEHLLLALLDQDHGLAAAILNKAEVAVDALKLRVQRELEKLPQRPAAAASRVGITSRLNRLLGQAEDEAKKLKDDYISVEHLLLAMLDDTGAGRQDPQGIRRHPRPAS